MRIKNKEKEPLQIFINRLFAREDIPLTLTKKLIQNELNSWYNKNEDRQIVKELIERKGIEPVLKYIQDKKNRFYVPGIVYFQIIKQSEEEGFTIFCKRTCSISDTLWPTYYTFKDERSFEEALLYYPSQIISNLERLVKRK